jgi:hypothetical protein
MAIAKKKKSSSSKPKNPALYSRVKAYANAWLVRTYKKRGGTY